MKYMVIEKFRPGCEKDVYKRYEAKGRMLPRGLIYLDSWLTHDGGCCFQLMETDDIALMDQWTEKWNDLVEFEIFPVMDSPAKRKKPIDIEELDPLFRENLSIFHINMEE